MVNSSVQRWLRCTYKEVAGCYVSTATRIRVLVPFVNFAVFIWCEVDDTIVHAIIQPAQNHSTVEWGIRHHTLRLVTAWSPVTATPHWV